MATLSTRGRYWCLNWTDASGKRHRLSLGRVDVLPERDARDILKAKQLELSQGTALLGRQIRRAVMFGAHAADYLLWHEHEFPDSHERVRQIVTQHLVPEWEFTPLDMLDPKSVEAYKHKRGRVAAVGTVIKELRTLQALVNHAVRHGVLDRNPIEHVAPPRDLESRPHRWYTREELASLYAATFEPWHAPAWRLYANTGMRRDEGVHLKWRDIGRDALRILSTSDARTKSGKWREIPLAKGAQEALAELRPARPAADAPVLPEIALPSISRAFSRCAGRAGLDGSLHTLRHTYISHLVQAGIPLRTVQIYAGHAHITTTEGYAYLMPSTTPRAVRGMAL
jgi:integrase